MFLMMMLLSASPFQEKPTFSHLRMPVFGTVYKGKLYGLFEMKEDWAFLLHAVDLKKSGPDAHDKADFTRSRAVYHRCRVRYDRVWLTEGYPFIKSMSLDEVAPFFLRSGSDGWAVYLKKYGKSRHEAGYIGIPALAKKPIVGAAFTLDGLTGLGTVPTSENTLKTFLLLTGKTEMEIWDSEARFNAKTMTWENVADEKNFKKLKSLFSEDFYVFIRKDAYYFVTESGKLYFAPPPGKGEGSRTMQELWWDAKRPITAIIEDADHDKVWLFAKDKNRDAKFDLFFEMKETVRYELFDPTKLRPSNVEGRAKALLEYLPLIMDKKK